VRADRDQDKADVRARMRAVRAEIPESLRREAAIRDAAGALCLTGVIGARAALAYCAMPEELDPSPLVRLLAQAGTRIAYPRVCGPGALTLHWGDACELAPGYCGILEPPAGTESASLEEIDLVIVPGVAFDEQCHRLGMGGGFYDRLLAGLPPIALKLVLAFDEQIVDAVPHAEHDTMVDAIVTPRRIFRRGKPATDRP
jgi:5-formyltetrahydrofolate cyclo-ligase